jgi:hypothetical protein
VTGRVRLSNGDRLVLIQLYRWFPSVLQVITVIRPETLVRWHRAGFRHYWRWKSRRLAVPILSTAQHFDGSVPTVTPTQADAVPYHATASMQNNLHISVLSKLIGASLTQGSPAKVSGNPKLALSLELYSGCEFAGERNAQFIVLMSALEVLVPKSSSKGKRGAVIAFVKRELSKAGDSDPKSAGNRLDSLYVVRNDLLHEAKPVSDSELGSLKKIVRSTLKALAG